MFQETGSSYPRPSKDDIEQQAGRLPCSQGWIEALNIMCQKEDMSLSALRGIGLIDWMERDMEYGIFAGWSAEDLKQLRDLLITKSRSAISESVRQN